MPPTLTDDSLQNKREILHVSVSSSEMLDVRRMQILRAVVTSGSVTAAASNLGYTTSAISQQLSVLEREAGIKLLERVGRGVRPTAAGHLLAEHAAVIGRHVVDAEKALDDLRAGRTGLLRVRYFATAGAALIPPAVTRLRREHPHINVELKLVEPGDPLPDVANGEADIAIVVRSDAHGAPKGTRLEHLLDDPFRAVLPTGHRLAAKNELELVDLAAEPWVGSEWPAGSCLEIIVEACAAAGFEPSFVVESDDYATAQGFVAAGMGISVIPELGVGTAHPGVIVRAIRHPEPVRSIFAAVRASGLDTPPVCSMLDALREAAAPGGLV
jgi:DNA-binding transcriptional LysR family regulator